MSDLIEQPVTEHKAHWADDLELSTRAYRICRESGLSLAEAVKRHPFEWRSFKQCGQRTAIEIVESLAPFRRPEPSEILAAVSSIEEELMFVLSRVRRLKQRLGELEQ